MRSISLSTKPTSIPENGSLRHLRCYQRGWVEVPEGVSPQDDQQKQSTFPVSRSREEDEMKAELSLCWNLCPAAAKTRNRQRKSASSCIWEEGKTLLREQKKGFGFGLLQKLSKVLERNFCLGDVKFCLIWILFLKYCKILKIKCFAESAWYPNVEDLCQMDKLSSVSVCIVFFHNPPNIGKF